MKVITYILFLTFIGLSNLVGQIINPLLIRQTLFGQVVLEVTLLDYLMTHNAKKPEVDSSKTVKCIEYKVEASGDTTYKSTLHFNYLMYPGYSPLVFTFQTGKALLHFPNTIERKMRTIDSKTIELMDFYWSGNYGHELAKRHVLRLRYNKKGHLVEIYETYKDDSDKSTDFIWKYKYKHDLLNSISAGEMKSIYQYDDDRNIISTINYSGKTNLNSSYLCFDSLASLYSKKTGTYELKRLLDNQDSEILQLAFYKYSKGKLIGMACYDSNYGIQITTVTYDSLQRISSFYEEHVYGGLNIQYTYEENSNRLLERRERLLSDCFIRGCPETEIVDIYTYNENGMIHNIEHKTYRHNIDGSKETGFDTGRGKKFQYQND